MKAPHPEDAVNPKFVLTQESTPLEEPLACTGLGRKRLGSASHTSEQGTGPGRNIYKLTHLRLELG